MKSQNEIKQLLKKYAIKPSKKLGQNFLFDKSIIAKIISATNLENKNVVEIGPGLGTLTSPLLKVAKSVTAYEIDQQMIKVLKNEIPHQNLHLKKADFLDARFEARQSHVIVANIPYHITTKIIFKIIQNTRHFPEAILMVQKEFGERIIARPKTKSYGKLSAALQSIATTQKVTDVQNTSFMPKPKVASMVVKIVFKDQYKPSYFDFLLKCFAQQRKTLANNLQVIIGKPDLEKILQTNGLKPNVRPQELSPQELKMLWKIISTKNR